jgi:hypothetical protein
MDSSRLQVTPFTILSRGSSMGIKYRMFLYHGDDSSSSSTYRTIPAVDNTVRDLWMVSVDTKIIWDGIKLHIAGVNR